MQSIFIQHITIRNTISRRNPLFRIIQITLSNSCIGAVTGKEVLVYYEVENTGTINETYEIAISDDQSASVLPMRRQHTILAGDISNGSFTMRPTLTSSILYVALPCICQYWLTKGVLISSR